MANMQMEQTTLKNGLPVMMVETDSFPSCTALLLVGAGSRYETPANNGIAHFFEHMVFKGTKKYPDAFTIAATIEGMGGVCNAFTDKDHTGYWIKAPSQHLETMLSILSQMITAPLLPEEEIEREKGVIIEEMNMYEDMPSRKIGDVFEQQMYEGTPLGYDIIGTREMVTSATRQTFADYMNQYYHPSNAVLVLAGSLKGSGVASLSDLKKNAEGMFADWPAGKAPKRKLISEPAQKDIHIHAVERKTEQAHFCLGFRTFGYDDPRKVPLHLLTAMLGGGMASRLFTEVRERRGLCYYISTAREVYHETGNIVTQAGVSTNLDKIQEAIDVTIAQHQEMAAGSFSEDELTRAKEMIKGRILLSLEDSHSIATFYGARKLLQNQHKTPEQVLAEIDAVTTEQVTQLATEVFRPERMQVAMIGPHAADALSIAYNS